MLPLPEAWVLSLVRSMILQAMGCSQKLKKKKKSQINNLSSQLKNPEKRTDSKAGKIKEIIKIKADIMREQITTESIKLKAGSLAKINKTDKPFADQEKKRLDKPLKSKIKLSSSLSSLLLILLK